MCTGVAEGPGAGHSVDILQKYVHKLPVSLSADWGLGLGDKSIQIII